MGLRSSACLAFLTLFSLHKVISVNIEGIRICVNLNTPGDLPCLPTSIELPHHGELEVLAVVPGVVQAKHRGPGFGLQLEGGQDEGLVHSLLHQAALQ